MGEDAGPVSFGIASLFGRSGRAAKPGGTGKSGGRGRPGRRSRAFRIGLVFAVLLVIAALIPAGFGAWLTGPVRDGAIARGVHAAGVDLSGLAPPDAAHRLESSLPSLDHSVVTARAGDHELKLTARQFGAWLTGPVRNGVIARGVHAAGIDLSGLTPPDAARRLDASLPSLDLWLAASAINGAIIAPKGLFSYNRRVGQRKISKGYRSAPIFVKGKVVEDTGGGVCQVATTVYNAALLAACSVVERYHHSARTSYIGPGRDATVSWGSLDLKFRNSRKEPIILTTSMTGGALTVRVWGHVHPGESVRVYTRDLPDGVATYRVIHRPTGDVRRELVSSDPPQERAE
ncbi:MAG: VanW family protein [Chloroflexi bacterium]|nr:VanW family protein [Chloroflexota bacterium]